MNDRTGQLIIASPDLEDPNFHRTVTLVIDQGDDAILGLTLNRSSSTTVREAWETSDEARGPCGVDGLVRVGGPCPGPLMLLHDRPELADREVLEGLWFSADPDNVGRIVNEGREPVLAFVGYAGWDPQQLEGELSVGSWLLARPTTDDVLATGDESWIAWLERVEPALAALERNPAIVPEDPSLN